MQRARFTIKQLQSIPELKDAIIHVIGEIEPHLCQNAVENMNKRVNGP